MIDNTMEYASVLSIKVLDDMVHDLTEMANGKNKKGFGITIVKMICLDNFWEFLQTLNEIYCDLDKLYGKLEDRASSSGLKFMVKGTTETDGHFIVEITKKEDGIEDGD